MPTYQHKYCQYATFKTSIHLKQAFRNAMLLSTSRKDSYSINSTSPPFFPINEHIIWALSIIE